MMMSNCQGQRGRCGATGWVHPCQGKEGPKKLRKEKISEKMKMLQSLVPGCEKLRKGEDEKATIYKALQVHGCEKVTSKALMVDEIISYVQSLENQVEVTNM